MSNEYDHYVALDWAESNMAVARMTKRSDEIKVVDVPSDIEDLKAFLTSLKGTKIMTIEETTTTHWLYTELVGLVDKLIICDPFRNKLLGEGAKTDKIDARKLVQLLRSGLVKEVYHSFDDNIKLRTFVSSYEDVIKAGVRLKNQRKAVIRSRVDNTLSEFVLNNLDEQIKSYEAGKQKYKKEFERLGKASKAIGLQESLPGIGWISAVKIVARVVDPRRFAKKGDYLGYCGLIMLDRVSGGRSYGKKRPRYSRVLKSVYKSAALSAIKGKSSMGQYYRDLMKEKHYPKYQARHAVARRIAVLSYGIFKGGEKYRDHKIISSGL